MENLQQDHLNEMGLQIDGDVRQQLAVASKWAKFISILVFVGCGLLLVFGVAGGAAIMSAFNRFGSFSNYFGEFGGTFFIIIVVFVVAVFCAVYYFLYAFAQKVKNALLSENTSDLNAGLRSLKTFFVITTIFAILSLLNTLITLFR